jgi:hypothetical protein
MPKKIETVTYHGKVHTKASIRAMLEANDAWLYRAVVAIYACQTANEQVEDNGIGFNGVDGVILSSYARQLNRTGTLSKKQIIVARKKMVKYAGQLLAIAREQANKA